MAFGLFVQNRYLHKMSGQFNSSCAKPLGLVDSDLTGNGLADGGFDALQKGAPDPFKRLCAGGAGELHSHFMMPRDMDLIRELLLRFERDDLSIPEGHTKLEVAYHVKQMVQSGLIDATVVEAPSPGRIKPVDFIFRDIKPAGHDFIAALKNDGFWAKLKREAAAKVAPLTLDLLVVFAKEAGKRALSIGDIPPDQDHTG